MTLHASVGLLLVLGAIFLLVRGVQSRNRGLILATSFGALAVLSSRSVST